jgi:hypothetical protein
MKREPIIMLKGKISQKLPLEFETKMPDFQNFVIGLC